MPAKSPRAKAGSSSKADTVDLTLSSDDNDEVKAPKSKAAMTAKAKPESKGESPAVNGNGKRKAVIADDDESDEPIKPAKKRSLASSSVTAPRKKKAKVEDDDDYEYADAGGHDDDEEMIDAVNEQDDDALSEDDEPVKPAKKAAAKKATPKKSTASSSTAKAANGKAPKKEAEPEEEKPKYKWQPKQTTGPSNPGSKVIPEGAPGALDGLTLVFTGELESLAREEAQSLAKRYGAKVTSSVSSKTSYVVLGEGAGPKKLETIAKNSIKTLDEDAFLKLIATRGAKDLDKKFVEKQKEEDKKIKQAAQSMKLDPNLGKTALWTVKYAPSNVKELCGNPGAVEKLQKWLDAWPKNLKSNFNKPGADGMGSFRAVLLHGPPGIGKTTSAHLVASLAGYKVIEMNASDTRSKKLLEASLRSTVDNTVLDGFLRGEGLGSADAVHLSDRSVLIMDEVDGTSAGDRGGIGALNALIKKTKVPIICIANDKSSQKMKPLLNTTFQIPFRRPEAASVRARLMTIAFKEGMKIDRTVADQLVAGTQSDIRQMINIMSTWSLSNKTMTFDETKRLTDTRDANSLSTPFALMDKLFGPYAWSQNHRTKLNDKLEIYFQEFDVMPLFVQENYLKHKYSRVPQNLHPRQAALQKAQITSKAADCISDGDLVDRMIHGTQQHWTLMPVHGMLSTVLPSYHCYGAGGYGGGWGGNQDGMGSARSFPGWFGKNSTQGRLQRALTEIQIRMRLKVSGDRREIRQSYIPTLYHTLVEPLAEEGNEAIEGIIDGMDQYYLTKEEWDALVELGIGDHAGEPILKKIKPATKTAFTRKYNTGDHPIPSHKATEIAGAKRMAAETQKPDLEEAFDVEVAADDDEDTKPKKAGEADTIKDKLVKAKKPKAEKKTAVKKEPGVKGKK